MTNESDKLSQEIYNEVKEALRSGSFSTRHSHVTCVLHWLARDHWRPMHGRLWEAFIAEGMPVEGILEKFCKIGGNLENFKFFRKRHKNYIRCQRNPMCRRRHIYINIANVGEMFIPYGNDLTKCFLTACKHNPYLAMRLAYYADIHAVTATGMNAVSLAVAHGFPILAVQLVDLGVTPFKKNHRGMNAFDFVEKTYIANKVVKYGLRHAVQRRQNRQLVYEILGNGFQDFIVAGILMEYLPPRTQNKIECWQKSCRKLGFNCWQCSLMDDWCPFPFDYCKLRRCKEKNEKAIETRYKKNIETMEFIKDLHVGGGWKCIGEDSEVEYQFRRNGIVNLSPPVDYISYNVTRKRIVVKQASVTYEGFFDKVGLTICWDNGDVWIKYARHPPNYPSGVRPSESRAFRQA